MTAKKKKIRLILNIGLIVKHIPPLFIWYSSCNHQKILNTKKWVAIHTQLGIAKHLCTRRQATHYK